MTHGDQQADHERWTSHDLQPFPHPPGGARWLRRRRRTTMVDTTSSTRAIVLGGGGSAGIAWESGLLSALLEAGVDLGAAELVVGTSAGSVVAVNLRAGRMDETTLRGQLAQEAPSPGRAASAMPEFSAERFMELMAEAAREATSPEAGRAAIGKRALVAAVAPSEEEWMAQIAAQLPQQWPEGRVAVTAVDTATGGLAVFDARSGVPLERAVAASCTVPAVFPPVHVDGRAYMDGGMRSATNADLAAGHDRVLVVSCNPEPPTSPFGPTLEQSLRLIEESGSALHVTADAASRAAFGANPLDPARRLPSFEAGLAQGRLLADRTRQFWDA
ncbi:patatin-like phospholipase family protein [Kocuria sp.]|uniref:patatin-like phospholipase family protein n=1 Tax=Kocuria sp. TaxID=1871328 RepID=UPI0026DDABB4|nr:patatin-like phospholipase family protein [Kocuria sp.]MDO4918379.1 patatin-like phospholipase family protein [Kocuria sp.]